MECPDTITPVSRPRRERERGDPTIPDRPGGRRSAGFTLIEIMAVVLIMGLLMGLVNQWFLSLGKVSVNGTERGLSEPTRSGASF